MRFTNLFKTTIVSVGHEEAYRMASEAPRAWWDQRGIVGATEPEQPAAIDMTDLHLIQQKYSR